MNELFIVFAGAVVGFAIGFVTCALFSRLDSDNGHNYGEPDEHEMQFKNELLDMSYTRQDARKDWSKSDPSQVPRNWK